MLTKANLFFTTSSPAPADASGAGEPPQSPGIHPSSPLAQGSSHGMRESTGNIQGQGHHAPAGLYRSATRPVSPLDIGTAVQLQQVRVAFLLLLLLR